MPLEDESHDVGESWTKPLAQLWQNRPPNMKKEREYNRRMGLQPPYCSVCTLFRTYQRVSPPTWDAQGRIHIYVTLQAHLHYESIGAQEFYW
jgi:hypothetical protein